MKYLILLAFLCNPVTWKYPVAESVDLIELNHKYAKEGKHTFSQVIFYERAPETGKYRVRDWVLVETQESLNRIPVLRNGVWETCFVKDGVLHLVRSKIFRESFTMNDPEVEDGRVHPKHLRRLLGTGKIPEGLEND